MRHFRAAHRLLAPAVVLALLSPAPVLAQPASSAAQVAWPERAAAAPRPWFYAHSDVPMDPAWHFGELPNGLRYAIRHNDIPAKLVSIRVRVDVGSLMETPQEAGFAHFIEHLSFRGSRDAPDGESKRIWQRLGVEFGLDSNAQTTATQTTYAVDLPDAAQASLDESLKILASMVSAPAIVPDAVEAERSIVMAERLENLGPGMALSDQTRSFYFAGQRLADHSPIGTEKTLKAATAQALTAFHDRWYRPDRTVVAISGDADVATLEAMVKEHFAGWKATGPETPLPDFGRPDPAQPSVKVAISPETPVSVSLAYLRPWKFQEDTVAFNQARMVDDLALQLINRRLAVAAQGDASFLQAAVQRDDSARSVSATYVSVIPIGDDWETALGDVRAIIEDARRTMPSKADIDREFVAIEAFLARQVETSSIESSAQQVDMMVGALDIRETVISPQAQLKIFQDARQFMTPEQVRDSTRRMFTGAAERVFLSLKNGDPRAQARLATAFRKPVDPARNARLEGKRVDMASLPSLGEPGKAVLTQPIGALGIEQVVFENGVTLFLNPNKAEPGKVRISVRFGHGQQSFSPDDDLALWAAPGALMSSGIGDLDKNALDELTNGRQLGLNFTIEDDAFSMNAVSSPQDYADQLRLFATKLAFPRWDERPLARTIAALNISYDPVPNSAGDALDRNIGWMLRAKDERVAPPEPDDAKQLTLAKFREVWAPRLANGPVEIQLYGDVQRGEAIQAVAATFGAMPRRPNTVPAPENLVRRFPDPVQKPVVLTHTGAAEQAGAVIAWPTGGGEDQIRESRQLSMLARIINDRLFEKLRSIDGAAYTPSAVSVWPEAYSSGGYLMAQTQLRPERIPYFFSLMDEIVADLAARPVSRDELEREVEPMRKYLGRARASNAFWIGQLGGLSRDPRKLMFARDLQSDLLDVTPEDLQRLAQRYLRPETRWTAVALAQGVPVPDVPPPPARDIGPPERVAVTDSGAARPN